MNKLLTLFVSAAAIAMCSCSDDKLTGDVPYQPENPDNGQSVQFTLSIDLPSAKGSRSETTDPDNNNGSTSNDGVEIGKDYENMISNAIVVIADATNNGYITAAEIKSNNLHASDDKTRYTASSSFSQSQLSEYYQKLPGNQQVKANIFVFCNPTQELRDILFGNDTKTVKPELGSTEWTNSVLNHTSKTAIWNKNGFLMSNSTISTCELPRTIQDWNYYTSEDKPFNLSGNNPDLNIDNNQAIRVERVAARFDFRDGSVDGKNDATLNGIGDFTYEVVTDWATKDPIVNVTLQKMAFVNMNKTFYALRHVSGDGRPVNSEICKPELPWVFQNGTIVEPYGNYVVDGNYTWKEEALAAFANISSSNTYNFSEGLEYPLFNPDGSIDNTGDGTDNWGTSICAEVIKGEQDNDQEWNKPGNKGDYHIWRYATENTIAGISDQKNGVSTGIVFKGKMSAPKALESSTDEALRTLATILNDNGAGLGDHETAPILYSFANNLYVSWHNIFKAAIKEAIPGFKKIEGTDNWQPTEITRSTGLFKAVFGEGGFGTLRFQIVSKDANGNVTDYNIVTDKNATNFETAIDTEVTYNDKCADKAWNDWNNAGKPANGDIKDAFKAAVTGADITIYQRSNDNKFGWGYYCYYYYWNRHNDNRNNGVMGPMEFAVVRNNVYKIAVTKLSRLGHPRISENDPENPTPDTDDEVNNVYITVETETLPWVVRINNIEF